VSEPSPYYECTGGLTGIRQISLRVRQRIFEEFMRFVQPTASMRVLDLGCTSDEAIESNFFEALYPFKDRIVAAGIENGSYLEQRYPGLRFVRLEPRAPLPFTDGEFDAVFSNAVIEHAGPSDGQAFFLKEATRVAKRFFITTPNRWFPVDPHTVLPLLHWLPKPLHWKTLRLLGHEHYTSVDTLNLLSRRELRRLFPVGTNADISTVRCFGLPSNLMAFGTSPAR
jgi:SAM-dependent methyltransferase